MGLYLWETLKESITDLSPAGALFTFLALVLAFYYVASGVFGSSRQLQRTKKPREKVRAPPAPPPPPPPVQVGEITADELRQFDGSDPKKPLLMAIKGQIYDVSRSRLFYGPGGPYALFAGKDASRALAKMSFEEKDLTGDISGLSPSECDALQDWEYKFMSKYDKVGIVKKTGPTMMGTPRRSLGRWAAYRPKDWATLSLCERKIVLLPRMQLSRPCKPRLMLMPARKGDGDLRIQSVAVRGFEKPCFS